MEGLIMQNIIFIVIDIIVFFILYLGLNINWIIAFFTSTSLTWAGYYLFYFLYSLTGQPKY